MSRKTFRLLVSVELHNRECLCASHGPRGCVDKYAADKRLLCSECDAPGKMAAVYRVTGPGSEITWGRLCPACAPTGAAW